jgi:hypothetical protein
MPFAPGDHPRLLFDRAALESLREQAQTGLRRRVLDHLRWVCADWMDPASPRYFDFRERRRELWYLRAGIFTVLPALHALAVGYAFTGDPVIGDCARDALLTIMEHGLADLSSEAWGTGTQGWRHGHGHDKGKFNRAIAWIYDFCYDRFSPAQRVQFADYARESIALADRWRQYDLAQLANNRGVRGILGTTWLYLALEGEVELPDLEARVQEAERAIDTYLFLSYHAAGAAYEGPGYVECLPFMTSTAQMLHRRGGPDLTLNSRFERILEYMAYELVPGGKLVNPLNDAHEPNGTITGSLPLLGTPRGALLPWLAQQLDLHPQRTESWLGEGSQIIGAPPAENLFYFLLWWRDGEPERTPAELGYPTARHFQARGLASMRTGWAANDWLVSHFCGRQEHASHRQGDYNHVSF